MTTEQQPQPAVTEISLAPEGWYFLITIPQCNSADGSIFAWQSLTSHGFKTKEETERKAQEALNWYRKAELNGGTQAIEQLMKNFSTTTQGE